MSSETSKKSEFYVKGKCFNDCEATLTVGEEKTQLYVCMDHLAKLSDYFQVMFFSDVKEKNEKKFEISDEKAEDMVRFFGVLIGTDINSHKITGDSVELLMRLADKFQSDTLKQRLSGFIKEAEPKCESASTIFDWLVLSVKYHMPQETIKVCLPGAACLPLAIIMEDKNKIGLELFAKLAYMKDYVLRAKVVSMTQTDFCENCDISRGAEPAIKTVCGICNED